MTEESHGETGWEESVRAQFDDINAEKLRRGSKLLTWEEYLAERTTAKSFEETTARDELGSTGTETVTDATDQTAVDLSMARLPGETPVEYFNRMNKVNAGKQRVINKDEYKEKKTGE